MSENTKILVVGATGYIGGSILSEILNSPKASTFSISALIRNPEQSSKLEALSVKTILFDGLDDLEGIRLASSQHDVVINAAAASHDAAAKAIVEGLADRQKSTGRKGFMIHTSGTSILGDQPYSGKSKKDEIWSDIGDAVYQMEKNHPQLYGQRVTDVTVVDTGLALGVSTYIVVPPTIYGKGSGPFATVSQQIPNLARFAYKRGRAAMVERGEGIWNHIHIADLSPYYLLLLRAILSNPQPSWLPSGPRAIFFPESGEHTWAQVSHGIASAMSKRGLLPSADVDSVSLKIVAEGITRGNETLAEISLASKYVVQDFFSFRWHAFAWRLTENSARAKGEFGRKYLGWKPERGDEDFLAHFDAEIESIAHEFARN